MSKLDELKKTVSDLLADSRVRDAIRTLRSALRPELDFQKELKLYEHNLQHAESAFASGSMTAQGQLQVHALTTTGVQALTARLRPEDLLPAPGNLTDAERNGKQRLLDLAVEKHARLQSAHMLETDEARRFAYERTINELGAQIAALKSELNS